MTIISESLMHAWLHHPRSQHATRNAGLVWSPTGALRNVTLTADWWAVKRDGTVKVDLDYGAMAAAGFDTNRVSAVVREALSNVARHARARKTKPATRTPTRSCRRSRRRPKSSPAGSPR